MDQHHVAGQRKQKLSLHNTTAKDAHTFPWQLVVHFSEPSQADPLRLVDEDSVQSHFFNSIKQVNEIFALVCSHF